MSVVEMVVVVVKSEKGWRTEPGKIPTVPVKWVTIVIGVTIVTIVGVIGVAGIGIAIRVIGVSGVLHRCSVIIAVPILRSVRSCRRRRRRRLCSSRLPQLGSDLS